MSAKLFHCGITEAKDGTPAPFSVAYLAGLEFPKITQKITGYGPEQVNSDIQGVVHKLTKERHAAVLANLKKKVVRQSTGKKAKTSLFVRDNRQFVDMPALDRPLADFIYMEPVDHNPQEGRQYDTVSSLKGEVRTHEVSLQEAAAELVARKSQLAYQAKEIAVLRAELEEATAPPPAETKKSEPKPEGKKGKPTSK